MEKDFDHWNKKKKVLDNKSRLPYFKEGEVWWVHIGLNIGTESSGKGEEFLRPILIIKKFNIFSCIGIPLGTSIKTNKYKISLGIIAGKHAVAHLSQIKNIDSRRLVNKIDRIDQIKFKGLKEKASELIFR